MLINHIEIDCNQCDYAKEKCKVCTVPQGAENVDERPKQLYRVYDVKNAASCPVCHEIKGHRACIEKHIKEKHPNKFKTPGKESGYAQEAVTLE